MNTSSHHSDSDATTPVLVSEGYVKPAAQSLPEATRWLALGAVVGPLQFVLASVVLGLLRPGYSPVSQQVSALAVGPNGVFMRAAFVLYGPLVIVGVIAVFRGFKHELGAVACWACTVLLVLSPLGILWAGIFTMNPETLALHTQGAELAFGTPIITFLVVGLLLRRALTWRRFGTWLLLGSPLTLALLIGFIMSVPPSVLATVAGGGSLGLWQRALGFEVMAWFVAMGWLAFRRS